MAATDARTGGLVTPYLERGRSVLEAGCRRLDAAPRRAILVPLAALQWALVLAVALTVGHEGSTAATVVQVLVLLPVALVLVYETSSRLWSRVYAAGAALVWVVLPYVGLLYSNRSFRHTYAHGFLVHVVGLAADARFVAMVAFLAAALLTVRALETDAMLDAAAAVGAAAVGAAFAPRAAVVAIAPVAALAIGRRTRLAATAAVLSAASLAVVAAAVAAGWLASPFAAFSVGAAADALAPLGENFWSGRLLEWLALAGIVAMLRTRRVAGTVLGVIFLAGSLSLPAAGTATSAARNLSLLETMLPVWGAFALLVAAIPRLLPRGSAPESATPSETLRRLRRFLNRPALGAPAASRARTVAAPMWAAATIGCCFALVLFVGVWNATRYPLQLGYDAPEHIQYADQLVYHGALPSAVESGAFYAPPGYYAVAGLATRFAEHLGMAQPHQAAQYLNVVFVLATAALLLVLVRLLFPSRPVVWVGAVGFFALLPVVPKTEAMFQPESLNMLLSTAAVTMTTWMLVRRRLGLGELVGLGAIVAAGQLVRASSLFTSAAVALSLLAALATRRFRRHMPVRAIVLACVALVTVTAPWYVRQVVSHRGQPGASLSSLELRPAPGVDAATFFDFSAGDVLNRPVRPSLAGEAFAQTYADLWGDWYGAFAWSSYSQGPSREALAVLQDQSSIGIVPTLLSIGGWLLFVGLAVRRRLERIPSLPLILLPIVAVGVYLWRAWVLPSPGSDLLKASYLLTTVAAWAVGFGLAVDLLSRRRLVGLGVAALMIAFGILELRFTLYGIREHHALF